jgi:hypothetical protein
MAVSFSSASGTGDVQVTSSTPSRLMGWSAGESAGSPAVATAVIRDGTSTSGTPVAIINLAASGGQAVWLGPQGIVCSGGIFLDRVTGTSTFTVFYE